MPVMPFMPLVTFVQFLCRLCYFVVPSVPFVSFCTGGRYDLSPQFFSGIFTRKATTLERKVSPSSLSTMYDASMPYMYVTSVLIAAGGVVVARGLMFGGVQHIAAVRVETEIPR